MSDAACGQGEAQKGPSVLVEPEPDAGEDSIDPAMHAAPSRCEITPDYLRGRKACTVDEDCEVVVYTPQCCKPSQLIGVAHESAQEVRDCAEGKSDGTCHCEVDELTRAEDGRVSKTEDRSDVGAECFAGECRTRITARTCAMGESCAPDEICVAYHNTSATPATPSSGGNAAYSLECVPNPCTRSLDCSCAQSVCERRDDVQRVCASEHVGEYDIDCGVQHI
jgi:hypothetical protein